MTMLTTRRGDSSYRFIEKYLSDRDSSFTNDDVGTSNHKELLERTSLSSRSAATVTSSSSSASAAASALREESDDGECPCSRRKKGVSGNITARDPYYEKSIFDKSLGYPICEHIQFISEGIGSAIQSIKDFLLSHHGYFDDEGLNNILHSYKKSQKLCKKNLSRKSSVKINKSSVPWDPNDFQMKGIEYEEYMESPEYHQCLIDTSIEHIEMALKYIKRMGPENICRKNVKKDKCYRKVVDLSTNLESELVNLKNLRKNLPKQSMKSKKLSVQYFRRISF